MKLFASQALSYSYPIAVTLLFFGVYLFFRFKINRIERKKLKSFQTRDISHAVETDSPVANKEKKIKQEGIDGIENRFSFIKKVFPLISIFLWALFIFVPYLGNVPTVYVSVIATVLSVIVGVSLRPFLENLFSGILISFSKTIKIGDTVKIDEHYGIIEEIGLTHSILKRWDWNRIVLPNNQLLQKEIQNLTMTDSYLWTHVEFFVSPTADLLLVESIAKKAAYESDFFNNLEEPSFWIIDLKRDAIKCWVAAWADHPSDAWELRHELRSKIIISLQQAGIKFHQLSLNSSE